MLRERLDYGHAETPDAAGGGENSVTGLRGVVHGRLNDAWSEVAGGTDGVAREFQLVIDDQNVGWLELALHQVLTVEEGQAGQDGRQHLPHFVGRQGALGQNLRESLFGVFHHDEEKLQTSQMAASGLEKSKQ